jgi:transposase
MEQMKSNTRMAGVDVGKSRLDAAVHGDDAPVARFGNDREGVAELIAWLKTREVSRVGMEATGGYERDLRQACDATGFEVVVHQPMEVKLFARLKRKRAKTDALDARLIAAATAQIDAVRAAQDPRLAELAERLTAYEQITDQAAQLKTCLEQTRLKDVIRRFNGLIRTLERTRAELLTDMLRRVEAEPDLLARFKLLTSLPGHGPVVALGELIRMPELGSLERGQAAALLGVAPYDRQSGQMKGQSTIAGGRSRPRRLLYLAALSAKRCDPSFKAFAERLAAQGKPPKKVIVAVMRKLIEAANLILKRGHPWTKQPAT